MSEESLTGAETLSLSDFAGGGRGVSVGSRALLALCAALIIVAGIFAYSNSFNGPFIFDDTDSIITNKTIKDFKPFYKPLLPPPQLTVSGRPVANLTLAFNYAFGELDVTGYHVVNLAIHLMAGLALFGLVRRTLNSPAMRGRYGDALLPLAFSVALLWTVHPLQTESVTYVIQRTESLASLFYLLTLYFAARSFEEGESGGWRALSVAACLLSMASKETALSAPLAVLAFDRAFYTGSVKSALSRRRFYYAALAATWLLLLYLVSSNKFRGGTVGFGLGVNWWDYAYVQLYAVVKYVLLVLWPSHLVFDYGYRFTESWVRLLPYVPFALAMIAGTIWALRKNLPAGVAGFVFFAVLAPSSSVIPVTTQMMAEHRAYLPSAAVMALLVVLLWRAASVLAPTRSATVLVSAAVVISGILGSLTHARNLDYRSEMAIWRDNAEKMPTNPRSYLIIARNLIAEKKFAEAQEFLERTKRTDRDFYNAYGLLDQGNVHLEMKDYQKARLLYEIALKQDPKNSAALYNLGLVSLREGKFAEATDYLERARIGSPDLPQIIYNLGKAYVGMGDYERGIEFLDRAAMDAGAPLKVMKTLADALYDAGRLAEAGDVYSLIIRMGDPSIDSEMLAESMARLSMIRKNHPKLPGSVGPR